MMGISQLTACAMVLMASSTAMAQSPVESAMDAAPARGSAAWNAARDAIWAKELAIYAGRSHGDLTAYQANTARNYLAWPPFNAVPQGNDGLQATGRKLAGQTREKLEMVFVDLALNGTTAVVYYSTHRTMRADGTPSDERFEVTHTWVREGGAWKVIGGMARARPARD